METITKHGASNFLFDSAKKQITFLDSRFYSSPSGPVPSVTTILDAYPKGAEYFSWLKKVGEDSDTIRDEAGKRGSRVHTLTERYDTGEEVNLLDENGNISMKLSEWAMFERYIDFKNRYPSKNLLIEQTIVCEALGCAGTLDRLIEIGGRTVLVDIKTSNAIYPSYWLQLAAYEKMLLHEMDIKVDDVAILWLNAKTRTLGDAKKVQGIGWQLVFHGEKNRDHEWSLFQATQTLWSAENSGLKPRETTYKLSYQL